MRTTNTGKSSSVGCLGSGKPSSLRSSTKSWRSLWDRFGLLRASNQYASASGSVPQRASASRATGSWITFLPDPGFLTAATAWVFTVGDFSMETTVFEGAGTNGAVTTRGGRETVDEGPSFTAAGGDFRGATESAGGRTRMR